MRHLLCFPILQARAEKWQLGGPGRPDPEHAALPGSQRRVAGTRGAAGEPPLTQSRRPSGPPAPSHRPHCGQLAARCGVARGSAAAPGTRQRRPCTRSRRSATLLERTGAEMRAQGRGQAEHTPSTPRPLSRVLLTPGRMATGPATPVTPAPATARVPEPTPPAAPPPGPGRTAGLGARRQ